jgi:hypothetical protein
LAFASAELAQRLPKPAILTAIEKGHAETSGALDRALRIH